MTKTCTKCLCVLPLTDFWKCPRHKDGLLYVCKSCDAKKRRVWRLKSKPHLNAKHKEWRDKNHVHYMKLVSDGYYKHRDVRLMTMKIAYAKLKSEILSALGGKCRCCGEDRREFLCIDHVNGGGCKDRKANNPKSIYYRIRKEGYPKSKYQLLCHNCSASMGYYGYCPHHPEIKLKPSTGRARYAVPPK